MMRGRFARARAMATRCASPPDSLAGIAVLRLPTPDNRAGAGDIGIRQLQHERHVVRCIKERQQVVELESRSCRVSAGAGRHAASGRLYN
jgi:hypothetical protein